MDSFSTAPSRVRLLVSVRDPVEARLAQAAGADLIDAKDPQAGALGPLPPVTVRAVVEAVGGSGATSAVAGEPDTLQGFESSIRAVAACGVDLVKVALGLDLTMPPALHALGEPLRALPAPVVAVLFADDDPDPALVSSLAAIGFAGAMIDTRAKNGRGLLDLMAPAHLAAFIRKCRQHGLLSGLAGSLRLDDIPVLAPLAPDYLGFRGGLCVGADRRGSLDPQRVADAVLALQTRVSAGPRIPAGTAA